MMLWSFGQVRATMLHPGMHTNSIFNAQYVATRLNRVAKCAQHVPPNIVGICCVHMLKSFDRSLQNAEPTMFRHDALECCDRLAETLKPYFT